MRFQVQIGGGIMALVVGGDFLLFTYGSLQAARHRRRCPGWVR
jgi:hypothetical protein